jgi:hypothetical protein
LSSHQALFNKLDLLILDGTTSVSGLAQISGVGNVTTVTSSAYGGNIFGNIGSVSYLWEYVSGETASIAFSTSLNTTFSRTKFVNLGDSLVFNGIYRIKATDTSTGNIAYGPNCTVSTTHSEVS